MSLSCPERIAAAIPAEVRASRIARARTFAAVHESGSGPSRRLLRRSNALPSRQLSGPMQTG